MASPTVELVRSIYAALEGGDFSSADWAHPDIEYVVVDGPSPATFNGLAELAAGMRELLGPWRDVRTVAREYRELDDERVLVTLRYGGRGKASGLDLGALSARGADVVRIHDGKVTQILKYYDLDRAFADLGLSPDHLD